MVSVTYLGHSSFKISGSKTIFVDPYLENPNSPIDVEDIEEADVVLVTHGHHDHVGDSVEICEKTGAILVSIFDLTELLSERSEEDIDTVGINIGGTTYVEDVEITMVEAQHSSDVEPGVAGGHPTGFVFEIDGERIYHAGDTGLFGDMEIIGDFYDPKIAMLPIGDHFTMGVEEANYALDLIKPEYVIPMHYNTFEAVEADPNNLSDAAAEPIILEPGESWEIE